jgi:hypothetical protein
MLFKVPLYTMPKPPRPSVLELSIWSSFSETYQIVNSRFWFGRVWYSAGGNVGGSVDLVWEAAVALLDGRDLRGLLVLTLSVNTLI